MDIFETIMVGAAVVCCVCFLITLVGLIIHDARKEKQNY
jgi:hypothetical protein